MSRVGAGLVGTAFGIAVMFGADVYDEYRNAADYDTSHFCENGNNMATLKYGDYFAKATYYHKVEDGTFEKIAGENFGATGGRPTEIHSQITPDTIQVWCDDGKLKGQQTEYLP